MQSGDLRHDQAFFGRTEELYELTHNLQRGRHTLLVGEKGIGKSRLMLEARKILSGRTRRIEFSEAVSSRVCRGHLPHRISPDQYSILYIEHPNPMGDLPQRDCGAAAQSGKSPACVRMKNGRIGQQ